jgi:glycosyltransferase involved in cell wall biosynthesis
MADVKNFPSLVQAFLMLLKQDPSARLRLRLLVIGDGNSRDTCIRMLREGGAEDLCWLPGERGDIPELMRMMDLFVLPSLAEGISNTILEAMSSGLPVVATRVGGNVELVKEGISGTLVPANSPGDIVSAIASYFSDPGMAVRHGAAARKQIETAFSMKAMTEGYLRVYDKVLQIS